MTPSSLLKRYSPYPTILDFDLELRLIEEVRRIGIEAIQQDIDSFIAVICRIRESHADNGIFEMNESTEQSITSFYGWLEMLGKNMNADLTKYADGLDLTCADIEQLMLKPSL